LSLALALSINNKQTLGERKVGKNALSNRHMMGVYFMGEKPLTGCGCKKFQLDTLGDHLCTCTSHSGAKKAHDWTVDQLVDLFLTTHKVKTQVVVKNRGQYSGEIELVAYLANTTDPVHETVADKIRKDTGSSGTDCFFSDSGAQFSQSTSGLFHYRRSTFSSQFKAKVGSTLSNDRSFTC
jgi:hypothetical protein